MLGMIKLCLCGLKRQTGRTLLVAISIAIGVFSVLIISVISDNGVKLINNELDNLGICGVSISKTSVENDDMLTNEDLSAIKKETYVESATPVISVTGYLKNDEVGTALICGIDENANSVISVETVMGNSIEHRDIVSKSMVCQIDEATGEKLFGNKSPLGKTVDVFIGGRTNRLRVSGIVKASSSILQTSVGELLPTIIYVPYTTLQNIIGTAKINQIAVNFSSELPSEVCIQRIKSVVGNNKIYSSSLQVEDLNKQRDSLNGIFSIITVVLKLIGGVSLIVSGIGIMTVMLISVNERTKEIGIKKAIGAKKRNIIFEFVFESAFIAVIGSILGIVLMCAVVVGVNVFFKIPVTIGFKSVIFTALISVICGIVFGVYPAIKASNLKPIEALRND